MREPAIKVRVVAQNNERDILAAHGIYSSQRHRIVWREGVRLNGVSPWWLGVAVLSGFIAGVVLS